MQCLRCQTEAEMAPSQLYARCPSCKSLFMNIAGNWQPYPVGESVREMIEQSLGFAASTDAPAALIEPPTHCLICNGTLEVVRTEQEVLTRCPRCGNLSRALPSGGLQAIIVEAPGGGWNPEFQAIFEEKLGFGKKTRRKPIGIPE